MPLLVWHRQYERPLPLWGVCVHGLGWGRSATPFDAGTALSPPPNPLPEGGGTFKMHPAHFANMPVKLCNINAGHTVERPFVLHP